MVKINFKPKSLDDPYVNLAPTARRLLKQMAAMKPRNVRERREKERVIDLAKEMLTDEQFQQITCDAIQIANGKFRWRRKKRLSRKQTVN